MKIKIVIIIGIVTLVISCSKKKTEEVKAEPQQLTEEAIAKADSLQQLAALHRGFVGSHRHNMSLKVHAHQNPSKKVRVFRRQNESADMLRQGMQKANEEREKRIKKILEKRNK